MRGISGLLVWRSWGFSLAALLPACGGPDDHIDVSAGEQEEAFCEASCTRDLQCEGRGTLQACEESCKAYVSGLGNFRAEAVEIVANCILDIPCSRFYGEDAFIPCWERAEREVEPSQATRRFCQAWSSRWFECGYSYSVDECEDDWATNSAAYLERISACMDQPCELIEACALDVQGSSG